MEIFGWDMITINTYNKFGGEKLITKDSNGTQETVKT